MITMVMVECIRNGLEADEVFGVRRLSRHQAEFLWDSLIKEEDHALQFTTRTGYELLTGDDKALWNFCTMRKEDIFARLSEVEKIGILETLGNSLTLRTNGGGSDDDEVARALEWIQVIKDEMTEEICVARDIRDY
jgi:hypothetical protein